MLEQDSRGFFAKQQHVAAFLQNASRDDLVLTTMPSMDSVSRPSYNYTNEVHQLEMRLQSLSPMQLTEITFFDGKLNLAFGMLATLMLAYGATAEEMLLHSFGETSVVHDSGVAVWKKKLLTSRIRPTTLIQSVHPERSFKLWDNQTVQGKHFQARIRVMPHSEFPSGSSCVCQTIEEFVTTLWPFLLSVPYAAEATPVILPSTSLAIIPGTLQPNPSSSGYTATSLNERCGATRLEGGMHFSQAVPAGTHLSTGMGYEAATKVLSLVPNHTSSSVRAVINATAPCAATCCSNVEPCTPAAQAGCSSQCKDSWDLPWFDIVQARMTLLGLPSREVATSMPFLQVRRQHVLLLSFFISVTPEILMHETIFQFRLTNTWDNVFWNSVAANHPKLQAIRYGRSRNASSPIVRSGVFTSDARIRTGLAAAAAILPHIAPNAEKDFRASFAFNLLQPTIGFEAALTAQCGAPEDAVDFDEGCLKSYFSSSPSPARLGQITAYDVMYYKVRDIWNQLGTRGGCTHGEYLCARYADYTNYNPESGDCLSEVL